MLLAFGCFADDPQSVLATVQRLAVVGIERSLYLGVCAAKRRTTTFTDSKSGILFNDPQFALRHEDSLPPFACANETAPVPDLGHFSEDSGMVSGVSRANRLSVVK